MIGSDEERKRLQELVKKETSHIDKTIRDMERYWDTKLVKMRNDLNVHQLMKRLDEKATYSHTNNLHEESSIRLDSCEDALQKLGKDMQYIANSFTSIKAYVTEIKKLHSEVLVGSKNVNCLSCGKDGPSSQEKLKATIQTKFPGFLKKGRPNLEDSNLGEYELGINIFAQNNPLRPKSEKKFRKRAQIKSNIKKIGQQTAKASRMMGLRRDKQFDLGTPQGFYDSYTDNENSFVPVNHKSIASLNDVKDQAESFYNNTNADLTTKYNKM